MNLAKGIARFFLLLSLWVGLGIICTLWDIPSPPRVRATPFSEAEIAASTKWTNDFWSVTRIYEEGGCGDEFSEATVSNSNGFEPRIIAAMVIEESNCNPEAVSNKGAIGLLQIEPYNVAPQKIGNLIEPRYNLSVGARMIKDLAGRYGLYGGLVHYNGNGPQAEAYARRVLRRAN